VDWEKGMIVMRTLKTGKLIATPITNEIKNLLFPLYKKTEEYIFPEMAARYMRSKGSPSSEFTSILKVLGIIKEENIHTGAGNRKLSDKTFHSLRHSVVSMLRVNSSFSSDLIRETVGHDSEEVERNYFTASLDSKRNIIDFLAQQITPTSD
jgi:integrase